MTEAQAQAQGTAAVFTGAGKPMEIRPFPLPRLAPGEMLVRVLCTTICASDLHTFHGRRTPPLLPVRWETIWAQPVDAVRAKLGVTPYVSPFPPDLFEQLSVAA